MKRPPTANRTILLWVIKIAAVWQFFLIIIEALGRLFIPFSQRFVYYGTRFEPSLLWSRANFDGIHYLEIARHGYGLYQQAFFPLYPLAVRAAGQILPGYLWGGLLVSWASLIGALFFLYKLVAADHGEPTARRVVWFFLLFPTAFFMASVYTESFFLFFTIGSFYAARTRRWLWAGILGAFASASRVVGVFLFPALMVGYWLHLPADNRRYPKAYAAAWPLLLIPVGLAVYMFYLYFQSGDPLMFFHVQSNFGAGRTDDKLILLYQVFWRYAKMLLTVEWFSLTYFVVFLEVLSGAVFLILTGLVLRRRWWSYAVFMTLAYLTPTLTGTFSSFPRYALGLFPGFILLGVWAEKRLWLRRLYPAISAPLLVISWWLFSRGYWLS